VSPVKIVAAVMLISLMLNAGLQCNRDHLMTVLKHYGLIGRALLANFIIVPILGVLAVRLFTLNDEIATGLLLMAIAPGVPFVVFSAGRAKGGSLGFAIALAVLMPLISIVTIPFTARLVLPANEITQLPVGPFLTTLVLFQLVPLLIGIVLGDLKPALADRLARPFGVLFLVAVVVLLIMLAPEIVKAVSSVYGSRGMMAMLCVIVLSVVTGLALGGPNPEYRRTLGIATALRNVSLCALIAASSFPNTLVAPAVMVYLIIQIIVSALVGAYFKRKIKPVATAAT
jgi:bile acid:Na+ symporter, BASS family